MKKQILAVVMASLMLVGMTVPCLAANGLTRSRTATLSKATFTHYMDTGAGQSISVIQQYREERIGGIDIIEDRHSNTMVGGATSVTTERKVTTGYQYTKILGTKGYVNGVQYESIGPE